MAQFGYSLDTALGQVYGDKRAAARQEWERIRREVDSGCCDKEGHPAELKHMPSKQLETELQGKLRLLYSNNLMQNFDYSKIMGSLREYYLEQRLRREEELAAGTTSAEVQTGAGAHRQQERLPQQVPHTDGSVWLKQVRHRGPSSSASRSLPPRASPALLRNLNGTNLHSVTAGCGQPERGYYEARRAACWRPGCQACTPCRLGPNAGRGVSDCLPWSTPHKALADACACFTTLVSGQWKVGSR